MGKISARIVSIICFIGVFTSGADAQWAQTNGPYGGYVYSLGVSGPFVLAGTHGAGAYRSSDNGATWTTARSGLVTPHVYAFLNNGSNLFAGCPGTGGGIWLSTDNGATWSSSGSGLTSSEVYGLARLDTNLFAATLYGGVFISTNNGAYWSPVNTGLGFNPSVWTVAAEGTNLFAGTYGAGAFVSTDNGTSWTESDSGITNKYVEQFAVTGAGIFAGTFGSGVFFSTDHGAHWNQVNFGLTDLYIRALLADGATLYCGNDNGVALSTDNGTHWQSMNFGLQNLQVRSLVKKGSWLYAGTNGGGVFGSSDGGLTWNLLNGGISNTTVTSFTTVGPKIYGGSDGAGVFVSSDNGLNWSPVNTGLTQRIVYAMTSKGTEIFAGTVRGVFRSTDGGAGWTDVSAGMIYQYVRAMASKGIYVYAGTSGGLLRSSDDGTTWSLVNAALNVYALTVIGTHLFMGTSGYGAFVSTDDGDSWTPVDNGLTNNVVFALGSVIGAGGDTNIYAGTGGSGIFRSTDFGANWNTANNSFPIHYVGAFATVGKNLFAGGPVLGIYLSTDLGASWSPVFTGLGNMSVAAIQPGPDSLLTPNLIIGTSYGSAWQRRLAEMIISDVGFPVAKGWNIISVPYHLPDYRTTVNFPTATSAAFAYEGSYAIKDTLENGVGYWLKFDVDQKIPLSGGAIVTDSVDVSEGWNLIGSVSSPMAAASITADSPGTVVSNFFGYKSGYYTTDSLQPMQGYWVKSNRNGMLYLSSLAGTNRANRISIIPTTEMPPSAPSDHEERWMRNPQLFSLKQNYPNPFNPSTTIQYALPSVASVRLSIYNLLGKEVVTLVDGTLNAGIHSVAWDASSYPSGIYYYRLQTEKFSETRKLMLIK
jgi:hypothetical protein